MQRARLRSACGTLEGFIPDAAAVEIVGPLPGDLQDTIVIAAAIMGGTKSAEASKALVDFLRTPEATDGNQGEWQGACHSVKSALPTHLGA